MKRFLCLVLIGALFLAIALPASAEVPKLGNKMFKYAKTALSCLASGDYDKVVTNLPYSGISPSADEWRSFTKGSFSKLAGSSPQTKYAVAYWTGSVWRIAVPLRKPNSGKVETFVLSSEDGKAFSGYACLKWSEVKEEYQNADYVSWKEEYNEADSATVENDID